MDIKTIKLLTTIELGTGLKADAIRKAIEDEDDSIGNPVYDIFRQPAFTVARKKIEVDLVAPTVAELGFKNGGKHSDILERALQLGIALCPPELGPQLYLQYKDQLVGDNYLFIAMEPIIDSYGKPKVFYIQHNGVTASFRSMECHPDKTWYHFNHLVFVSRK